MSESQSLPHPLVICLLGPTAAGKTDLAVELVQRFPLDIISVDSAMVYRGMDIGTAKPDAALLRIAPHRLIDLCDPLEPYSAAMFRRDALEEIRRIHGQGRIPLLVGGTMLYFRALTQGLSPLPSADEAIRQRIEDEGRTLGWALLHARLARIDPASAARIHPNDPQRIQRALEVYEMTGRPMSELFGGPAEPLPFTVVNIHVMPGDRAQLHRRIAERFHRMIDGGLLAEVESLYKRGDLGPWLPAIRAVGYRQLWPVVAGEAELAPAVEQAITETRRLARRQMTWMRAGTADLILDGFDAHIRARSLKFVSGITHYQL